MGPNNSDGSAMQEPELVVCRDPDELASQAASRIAQLASQSVATRGRFTCALTGGSTPRATYQRLAAGAKIDWTRAFWFFGDERFVPPDDARSNYKMANEALLGVAPIRADHVFPIPTTDGTPAECAARYARSLQSFFETSEGQPPVLDLVLLGMGDDGHVASLFPHAPSLSITDATVVSSPPGTLPPPVDRITITFGVINAARQVLFLIAGDNKARALSDVWRRRASLDERPAAGVRPTSGHLTWMVDRAAASLMEADNSKS